MGSNDTVLSSYKCHFKKLENDTIFSYAFHYQTTHQNNYANDVLYTGEQLVDYSEKDKRGEIMLTSLWAKEINKLDYTFFAPLVDKKTYPLSLDLKPNDKKNIELLGEEKINNINCYHLKMEVIPSADTSKVAFVKTLKTEYHYWISQNDFIPIQYSIADDFLINNDTMNQYQKFILSKYELNNLTDTTVLTMNSIPKNVTLTDYSRDEYGEEELLAIGSTAPDWTLPSTTNGSLSLASLNGKVVLVDFFFNACLPCKLAIPDLKYLHKKYKDKGLEVISINPFDKKEAVEKYISNNGIPYPVLFDAKNVADAYKVSGYPTFYLIDKQGKIRFIQSGYGEDDKEKLEKMILKNL